MIMQERLQKTVAWSEGSGNITIDYDAIGDDIIQVTCDSENKGKDRSMSLVLSLNHASKSIERKITQLGLREELVTSDGNVFYDKDGNEFLTLKS